LATLETFSGTILTPIAENGSSSPANSSPLPPGSMKESAAMSVSLPPKLAEARTIASTSSAAMTMRGSFSIGPAGKSLTLTETSPSTSAP
jgi:hypothetical protein